MAKKPNTTRAKKGDALIGATVDKRWHVLEQLGTGGMGAVYRGERVQLGKQVALKFLHETVAESKEMVARFEREAKAISRLHHIHCVSILDFGVYRRRPYIVMEFIQGRSLTDLDPADVTPTKAVGLMRQVLMGLAHAHARGVIHRDLKMSNIMLVEMTGTEAMVKILDFGLARLSGEGGSPPERTLTAIGFVAGTPSYMSPEQAGGKKVDKRTDIYSAGVILYTLCTGKRPFYADDTAQLLAMHINRPPVSPRKLAPGAHISEALEQVIMRALEKRPEDRYQDATEFQRALDDTPEGQQTSTPTVYKARPRRKILAFAALSCIALGAAGALVARAHFAALRARMVKLAPFGHGSEEPWFVTPDAAPAVTASRGTPVPALPMDAATSVRAAPPDAAPEPKAVPDAAAAPGPPRAIDQIPPAPAHRAPPPPTADIRSAVEKLIASGQHKEAAAALRKMSATNKQDGWAHVRLGDVYLEGSQYRKDAFEEWGKGFALDPGLKQERAFRKDVCDAIDTRERELAREFFTKHFGPDETVGLLSHCIKDAPTVARIENAVQIIEVVAVADKTLYGPAALRELEVAKTCVEKKRAVEKLGRLHYARARDALNKLKNVHCLGTAVSDALDQLNK
ncbi:MAG TPA: serine/threonine-protein kinase [Polyangia bacterium]|nr:serine/threonine-protein kinase [Polyangia bacterium]